MVSLAPDGFWYKLKRNTLREKSAKIDKYIILIISNFWKLSYTNPISCTETQAVIAW